MLSRRNFLMSGAALPLGAGAFGAGSFGAGQLAAAPRMPKQYFGVHPFVEANPKAVFIMRTKVKHKFDDEAKLNEGLRFAREVLVPMDAAPGTPTSHRVILKPNCTNVRSRNRPNEDNWGTGTDPQFYEGIIMGMKELGLKKFHFLEANNFQAWNYRGMADINDRHGVICNEPDRRERNFLESYEMNWTKVPEPVVYTSIPHYAPLGEPDTWLINIAKWKSHGMCMTLTTKNEQGMVVKPYVRFCPGWRMVTGVPEHMKPNINPNVERVVNKFFDGHVSKGYPRYQSKAELAPMNHEIWAHKTLDHYQTTKPGIAIIEGIYGRDGNGFAIGNDYMTNLVMFSKDKLRLDMVGMWLGGHEPGNVNLFRIAKERGMSDTFNPHEVPVYEWSDGQPSRRQLTDFERTPLKTYYLQVDGEPEYHLVNDPIDYDKARA